MSELLVDAFAHGLMSSFDSLESAGRKGDLHAISCLHSWLLHLVACCLALTCMLPPPPVAGELRRQELVDPAAGWCAALPSSWATLLGWPCRAQLVGPALRISWLMESDVNRA